MPRLLLIAPIYTASSLTGGGQRTLHLFEALRRFAKVDLLLVSEDVVGHLERDLPSFRAEFTDVEDIIVQRSNEQFLWSPSASASPFARLLHAFRRVYHAIRPPGRFYAPSPAALQAFRALLESRDYDAIFVRYLQAAGLSGALTQNKIPVLVDLDDLDEAVVGSRAAAPTTTRLQRMALQLRLMQLVPLVRRLRSQCSHVFTATQADRVAVDHPSSSVLPNIPFRKKGFTPPPPAPDSHIVLFVGTYDHRVNRDGVQHFVKRCWPSIRRGIPDARFRVVGSGAWDRLRHELQSVPGVEVVGRVDDLYDEYAAAALCVAPLHEGSGTKIKVLEALLFARVVVATRHSTRGFEDLLNGGVVAATSDQDMVEQCIELLSHPSQRAPMSAMGVSIIARQYSPATIVEVVERALVKVRSASRAPAVEVAL